jgi:hypothetical protein
VADYLVASKAPNNKNNADKFNQIKGIIFIMAESEGIEPSRDSRPDLRFPIAYLATQSTLQVKPPTDFSVSSFIILT